MSINVRIFTPKGIIWEGTAQSVILPSSDGEMGILSGHIRLITCLKIGILRIRVNLQLLRLFILEGFAQEERDDVAILVNDAQWSNQISIQQVEAELEAAETSLKQSRTKTEKVLAKKAIKIAQTRLKAAQEL
ncbi:MAG: ATP synthase F1 subunit epsilon [Xenococcus sp. (in: cyanobacteria)]